MEVTQPQKHKGRGRLQSEELFSSPPSHILLVSDISGRFKVTRNSKKIFIG
jgi:hypothetical protein